MVKLYNPWKSFSKNTKIKVPPQSETSLDLEKVDKTIKDLIDMDMIDVTSDAGRLANEHWNYIKMLLEIHSVDEKVIDIVRFHYITAFIHGYKHGVEDSRNKKRK